MPAVQLSGRSKDRRDRGFTLIETVVAIGVFAVIATAALTMLIKALGVQGDDRQRVRAASLAAQEIERVRGLMQANPAAVMQSQDGHIVTAGDDADSFTITWVPTVGQTTYRVISTGEWADNGSTNEHNSLNLSVQTTWDQMHGVLPVVNSSVITINGTGGDGSGGASAPPISPTPQPSQGAGSPLPASCDVRTSLVGLMVDSKFSVLGIPTLAPVASGTVYAAPAPGNPCTANIPMTLVNGVATGSLPYGKWTITGSLNNLAGDHASESVNVAGATMTADALIIPDTSSCANTGLVALTVQSKNIYTLLTNLLSVGTVRATRAPTSTCAAATVDFTVAAGLAGGNLSYGDWTFTTVNNGQTASATATISSPVTLPVTLTVNDLTTTCQNNGSVALTVNTKNIFTQVSTLLSSGTVTATRAATPSCAATTLSIPIVAGLGAATLSYGDWTFSTTVNGQTATGTATISTALATPVTLTVNDTSTSCGSNGLVAFTVQSTNTHSGLLSLLNSGTIVATRAATPSCPAVTQNIPYTLGVAVATLSYGDWTFAVSNGTSTVTAVATVSSPLQLNVTLNFQDNSTSCDNNGSVNLTVNTKNTLSLVTTSLASGTVTATRAATSTCAATTQSIPILNGSASATLSYGDWTFSVTNAGLTATGSATINSATAVPVTLQMLDNSCPTISAPITLTVNQSASVYGTLSTGNIASGTVTATRAAQGACGIITQTFPVTSGSASGSLPFGNWTLSLNGASAYGGSWPTVAVSTSTAQVKTVTAAASCSSSTGRVAVTVKAPLLTSLTGTLRATMTGNGSVCQPVGATTTTSMTLSVLSLLLQGSVNMDLVPGTYTFSLDGRTTSSLVPSSITVASGGNYTTTLTVSN